MVNYAADEKIHNLINQQIQKFNPQKKLDEMSKEELQIELAVANEKQDFERSSEIVKIMKEK